MAKKRLFAPLLPKTPSLLDKFSQYVGQTVGLVSLETFLKSVLTLSPVNPAVPLAVVVLEPDPLVKAPAAVGRHNMHRGPAPAFLEPVQMPFAEIGCVVSVVLECVGDRLRTLWHRVLMTWHAVVRISAGQQRSSRGTAKRKPGQRVLEVQALSGQTIHVRRVDVWVPVTAQSLCPVLISEDPYRVLHWWFSPVSSLCRNPYGSARLVVDDPVQRRWNERPTRAWLATPMP